MREEGVGDKMKHRYMITFRKLPKHETLYSHGEISDSAVLGLLYSLLEHFEFEVVSVSLEGVRDTSKIIIKTQRTLKDAIFLEFSTALQGYVCNTTLRRVIFANHV